ncbi:MAG TPA: ADOP family duplicated permease [Vicinamibacterales bacterium]|nr:ADOP family duplicated permease [Vicinamibacterales bacterium]
MPTANLTRDVSFGWRRLRATPLFTAFAVLTLAAGIGVTTAVYSIVRATLSPPSGVRDAGTLVYLYHFPCCSGPIHSLAWPDFEDFRDRQTVYDRVAAYGILRQTVSAPGGSESAFGEIVSGEYFNVLGVNAALGRTLQPQDDQPGAPLTVVLSHGVWQRLFGGSPDAIGQTVRMGGHVFEIVGVAPRQFRGLFNSGMIASAIWVPLQAAPLFPALGMAERRDDRDRHWLRVVGRLNQGRTIDHAATEATRIAAELDAEHPIGQDITDRRLRAPYAISRPWAVRSMADLKINITMDDTVGWLATIVMVSIGLVLMVACSNLANLLLARASLRRQEMAVRRALGASRWRLVRENLVESAMLAAGGGLAGLVLARVIMRALGTELSVGPGATLSVEPRLDAVVLLVSFAATGLALVVAGLGPALQAATADVRGALATDSGQAALPRWRGRRLLIAAQVAVSVVVLSVAALFLGQIVEEGRIDSGLDLAHTAVAEVDFAEQGLDQTRTRQIVADVLGQLENRADVEAAAVSSGLPVGMTTPGGILRAPGQAAAFVEFVAATPGIFDTTGVSIVRGRPFDERDTAGSEPVMVVNETTARTVFGTIEVVGRQVEVERRRWVGEEPQPPHVRTVVGVASDSDAGRVGRRENGVIFLPFEQQIEFRLVFSARGADPSVLVGVIRSAIRAADRDLGIARIGTADAIAAPSNVFARVSAGLAGVLGAFALLVALAGLYGVLSHVVARRTREIGLRMALGASRSQILRLIVRQGLGPIVIGVLAGGALGGLARLGLQPGLARLVPAVGVWALVSVPLLLLGVGILACYLPARRAARVDPNVALRAL